MARLSGIARRERKRAPMQTLELAEISPETGVASDSRGRPGARQVTLLSRQAWQAACRAVGTELPWTLRRSNLLIDDFELPREPGAVIGIGDVRLEVTMEVAPCSRMDEQCPGLRAALTPEWRGGVACRVQSGGRVALGDEVRLLGADDPA